MKKDIMSVRDVMVMETAASLNVAAILSGTGLEMLVLLQAANMTKVSSIPIPVIEKYDLLFGNGNFSQNDKIYVPELCPRESKF